jgi:pyruvate dehydrogenase E2 component (dihydrolipoamide acetyltransferase)
MPEPIATPGGASARPFVMPSLGADMEAGTILAWRIAPGDRVRRGDIVADIETEKAEMEVEIFDEGVVDRILVPVGEKVAVGTPLALILASGAAPERLVAPPRPSPPPPVPTRQPPPPPRPQPPVVAAAPRGERAHVTPLARRLAESLGVDLASLSGSGPGGAVTADDVRAAAGGGAPAPPVAAPGPPAEAMRAPAPAASREASRQRVIAALMERSKREIPHYYLSAALDLSLALAWLEARNRERPVTERVLPAALLYRAVAIAVRDAPELNGHFTDGAFQPASALHLGVAIALRGGGLLAPAILDAGTKTLDEIMRALRELGERARTGKLRASEMSSATLTVTSLGERGVDAVHAVIYPPQVAIVGFGAPALRPWVDREGGLCARTIVQATLAADHRVSNGQRGARFLAAIGRALLEPEKLA